MTGLRAESLDTIVVTATRVPTPLAEIAVPVIVIDREEIERSLAGDIGELLRHHAGLEIARNGGPGQSTSLFIRGTNSDHAVVMIDGVRINPGTIGGAAIQNIAPESVERIEVVKGPRSSLYGTDAIGGVVNILTRAGTRTGVGASATSGRYGTQTIAIEAAGNPAAAWRLGGNLGFERSDGFPAQQASVDAHGFSNLNGNLFAQFDATDTLTLSARGWMARGESEYADFFGLAVAQNFRNSAASIAADWRPSQAQRLQLRVSRIEDAIAQRESADHVDTERLAADLQFDQPLGERQALTVGALLEWEDVTALSFGSGLAETSELRTFFIQDRINAGQHSALLALGYSTHESFGNQLTWNSEYSVALGTRMRLSFAAGTAMRAPNGTDRFGFGGNPDLEAEFSRQLEIGLRYQLGAGQQLHANAFNNDIRDLIVYVVQDPVTFAGRNENVGRARIRGVELGYGLDKANWSARLEASFSDPRNRDDGSLLLRRARTQVQGSLLYRHGRIESGMQMQWSGSRADFGFPDPTRLDSYLLVGAVARFQQSNRLGWYARLDNALDERYQLAAGYNTAGRSINIGARLRLD
ncbi:MAG: TonB-dependent receptor [Steroidobacteraceae bacterium]